MGYNCPTIKMSKEIDQIIDQKNDDGSGMITVIATDGTSKSERYDNDNGYWGTTSKASATETATQRVQNV